MTPDINRMRRRSQRKTRARNARRQVRGDVLVCACISAPNPEMPGHLDIWQAGYLESSYPVI